MSKRKRIDFHRRLELARQPSWTRSLAVVGGGVLLIAFILIAFAAAIWP